jgi:catechol 2,3-dioxygenase-like lactoylglutathione lyase family enzyme
VNIKHLFYQRGDLQGYFLDREEEGMVTGIHHTSLVVSDMERSLTFYRDLLGMTVAIDTSMSGEMLDKEVALKGARLRVVELNPGSGPPYVELLQYYAPPGKPFPKDARCCDVGMPHIALIVPSIQEAYDRMSKQGTKFTAPPQNVDAGDFKGSQTVYCYDPDGIVVELWQMPD